MPVIRTTCGYCSVGCNLDVLVEEGAPAKILPAKDYPVNLGKTCTKGFNLLKALEAPDRALVPTLRDRTTGERRNPTWDEAAAIFKARISRPDWEKALRSGRSQFDALKARAVKSATFTRTLPGAPDGEYVVIQFDTQFENKAAAVETVTAMHEKDGSWRVAGYFIK